MAVESVIEIGPIDKSMLKKGLSRNACCQNTESSLVPQNTEPPGATRSSIHSRGRRLLCGCEHSMSWGPGDRDAWPVVRLLAFQPPILTETSGTTVTL